MEGNAGLLAFVSVLLVLGSVFFVAAEYAMVSARKSRLDALARRGSRNARSLSKELDDVSKYVAGSQIGITMISVGVGSVTEPFVTHALGRLFGANFNSAASHFISFVLISFVLVVVGELCP